MFSTEISAFVYNDTSLKLDEVWAAPSMELLVNLPSPANHSVKYTEDFDDRTCTSGTVLDSDSSEADSTICSLLGASEEDSGEGEAAEATDGPVAARESIAPPEYSASFDSALAPREVHRQGAKSPKGKRRGAGEKANLDVYFVTGLQSAPASSTGPGAAEPQDDDDQVDSMEGEAAGVAPRALLMPASFSSLPRHTPTDDGALAPRGVHRQCSKEDLATPQCLTEPGGSQEQIAAVPAEKQPVAVSPLPLPLTRQPVYTHR